MHDAVVVGAVRTPIGRYNGSLRSVRPDDLAAIAIRGLLERTGLAPDLVDDVFWGAANQAGEDNRNVARMSSLLAGLPVEVPGATVNRLCGSGLQAVISAAREIQVGAAKVVIAGGVESMTRAPFVLPKSDSGYVRGNQTMFDTVLGWRMVNDRMHELYPPITLGETAERVARRYGVSRRDQDEFALRSHTRACNAQRASLFSTEIVPVETTEHGSTTTVARDEGPRSDTSLEKLTRLQPAFEKDGTVTAGNSSPLNDGAAALLLMSSVEALEWGMSPIARFVDAATAGVHPDYMGIGPVPATQKLLRRHAIQPIDIDFIEINEAFAAQAVACIRELDLQEDRVNPLGGAIALGHPLGASGARLVTTLVHQMQRQDARYGLATMCVGVGQGISAIFDRVAS